MEGFKGPDFAVDRGILRRRDFQGMSKKTEAVEAIPTVENLEDAERRVAEEKVSVRCAYQAKQ